MCETRSTECQFPWKCRLLDPRDPERLARQDALWWPTEQAHVGLLHVFSWQSKSRTSTVRFSQPNIRVGRILACRISCSMSTTVGRFWTIGEKYRSIKKFDMSDFFPTDYFIAWNYSADSNIRPTKKVGQWERGLTWRDTVLPTSDRQKLG